MDVIPITGELTDQERQYAQLLNTLAEPKTTIDKAYAQRAIQKMAPEELVAMTLFAREQLRDPEVVERLSTVHRIAEFQALDVSSNLVSSQRGPSLTLADRVDAVLAEPFNAEQACAQLKAARSR